MSETTVVVAFVCDDEAEANQLQLDAAKYGLYERRPIFVFAASEPGVEDALLAAAKALNEADGIYAYIWQSDEVTRPESTR